MAIATVGPTPLRYETVPLTRGGSQEGRLLLIPHFSLCQELRAEFINEVAKAEASGPRAPLPPSS